MWRSKRWKCRVAAAKFTSFTFLKKKERENMAVRTFGLQENARI
jgi:hypothetical protein